MHINRINSRKYVNNTTKMMCLLECLFAVRWVGYFQRESVYWCSLATFLDVPMFTKLFNRDTYISIISTTYWFLLYIYIYNAHIHTHIYIYI